MTFNYCLPHLLHNTGVVVTSLSDLPTLRDIVCFAVPRVAPKWYDVGIVLDVRSFVLDGIAHEQKSPDQPRTLFVKWLQKSPGTGNQTRTWKSVLEAVEIICGQGTMEEIRTAVLTPRCPATGERDISSELCVYNCDDSMAKVHVKESVC